MSQKVGESERPEVSVVESLEVRKTGRPKIAARSIWSFKIVLLNLHY